LESEITAVELARIAGVKAETLRRTARELREMLKLEGNDVAE